MQLVVTQLPRFRQDGRRYGRRAAAAGRSIGSGVGVGCGGLKLRGQCVNKPDTQININYYTMSISCSYL